MPVQLNGPAVGQSSVSGDGLLVSAVQPFLASRKITTPAVISVMGVDRGTSGRVFGSNRSFGPYAQSEDYGATWTNRGAGPAGTAQTAVQKFVVFGGMLYCMTATAGGVVGIYRTANNAASSGDYSWSGVLEQTASGIEGKSTCFNAGSQYLFFGEYESTGTVIAGLGGPRLRRSADGVTWETVWGRDAAVKHVHCVAEDPYRPGHIYMTLGDGLSPYCVLRSKQHGAPGSWENIIPSVVGQNLWQSVQLSFSQKYVWMASDRSGFAVAVFDRDELVPKSATLNHPYMMAVPAAAAVTDRFFELGYLGAVDPETEIYYLNQSDSSSPGNTCGNFVLPAAGGQLQLLDAGKNWNSNGEVYVFGPRVFIGNAVYNRWF